MFRRNGRLHEAQGRMGGSEGATRDADCPAVATAVYFLGQPTVALGLRSQASQTLTPMAPNLVFAVFEAKSISAENTCNEVRPYFADIVLAFAAFLLVRPAQEIRMPLI